MTSRVQAAPSEQGAVVLFVALMTVALLGMVSLALDLYLYTSQKQRYEQTAEQIALAAIKEYFFQIDAGTAQPIAFQRARGAGQRIARLNLTTDAMLSFVKRRNAGQGNLLGRNAAGGQIQFGTWDFAGAKDTDCQGGTCFTETTAGVNAARVEFKVPDASPLRAMFGGALGYRLPVFSVFATGAAKPRHVMFLVDLSRSVTRDNYRSTTKDLATAPGRLPASEFAYDMLGATAAECSSNLWSSYHTMGMPEADALTYGSLFDTAADARPYHNHAKMHPKEDYRCLEIPTVPGAKFAINLNPNHQPEPLTTILNGISRGLNIFAARGVPGDMIGMLGFDDAIIPARKFALAPVDRGNADFLQLVRATNTNIPIERRVEYFMFPRYWGSKFYRIYDPVTGTDTNRQMPAMTDVWLGLSEAEKMLAEHPNFDGAENIVVLFTDGLHNCPQDYRLLDGAFPCRDDDAYVQRAMSELWKLRDVLQRNAITLHTFLMSGNSGPHIVLRKQTGEGGGCMWPETARYDPFWNSRMVQFHGGSMDSPPFYMPNYLYFPTTELGGSWLPLVDPCEDGTDITASLNSLCDATEGGIGSIIASSRWTDAVGRLECNYKGRTKAQQLDDFMRQLTTSNPYILVE